MEKIDLFEKFNTFQIYYRELLKDNIYDNGNLASYIKTYYIENNKILFHVSEILDLSVIVPKGNFDMYQKKFSEKLLDIFTSLDNVYEVYDGNYKDEIEYLYITHLLRSASMRFLEYDDTKEYLKEINDIIRTRFPNWKKNKYLKLSSFKLKIICYLAYNKKYRLLKILMKIKK